MTTGARLLELDAGHYRLEGVLDFSTVVPVAVAGQALLKRDASIHIDLSAVTGANSAGLVLLLEWMDVARSRRARLTYSHLPASLARIARMSNLADLLPLTPPRA